MNKKKEDQSNQGEVLQKVAEAITEKPTVLTIDIKPKSKFEAWLIKSKIKPSKRVFEIKKQRVDNMYRIAGRAVKFNTGTLFQTEDRIGSMMDVLNRHAEDIFYIVATAIQNDHREPTNEMINIVRNEFDMDEVLLVLKIAISNYNINAFMNSIVLIVGVDALKIKTSPTENGS